MIKYVIMKELEVEDGIYESEEIGIFDTEEEANQKAENIFNDMPGYEQQYYEISVWRLSGDSLEDMENWEKLKEAEEVMAFYADSKENDDELWEKEDYEETCDPNQIVHYCLSPFQDGVRVWIGDDPNLYVDSGLRGYPGIDTAFVLRDWYKKHGRFVKIDWKECFPESNRERYLDGITSQGYSIEEALEILRYLPQTDSVLIADNVMTMIELWERKAKIIEPYRMPLWKKMIIHGDPDLWKEDIYSPRAEQAWKKGWIEGRAELVKLKSETENLTYKEVMEMLEIDAEDQERILEQIEERGIDSVG